MFKGSTEIKMNEATIVLALQEYLEKRSAEGFAPVVKSVKTESSGYGGSTFIATITERDAETEKGNA